MPLDRRALIGAGTLISAGVAAGFAEASGPRRAQEPSPTPASAPASEFGIIADTDQDQTTRLQAAVDRLSRTGTPLMLPPGRYLAAGLLARPGTRIHGIDGSSRLTLSGPGPLIAGRELADVTLDGIVLDGGGRPLAGGARGAIVQIEDAVRLRIRSVTVTASSGHGIALTRASGRITDCFLTDIAETAIFSLDARGLEISGNVVDTVYNNGIQVWRSNAGEDATLVTGNRITRVLARNGGTGQYGNGINVFRAGSVIVSGNRITDCAYSAVRGNAASNIQILANSCERIGEVALYAEFGFQGAIIAQNLVDTAATGVSVTNFNEGGRLAVVQGNLIRNLFRREYEPDDKRGEGIAIEADAAVSGNVIESAPTVGIMIGWTRWMRDVAVTSNVVRDCRIGIGVTADPGAGAVLIASNLVSGARDGAIRGMQMANAVGPDLARSRLDSTRVAVTGNVVAGS